VHLIMLFTKRLQSRFFSYKRNILTLIWRKKKSFFFDLQENFPKVRTVYKLFFLCVISLHTLACAFCTNGVDIYTVRTVGLFRVFPFQLRIISYHDETMGKRVARWFSALYITRRGNNGVFYIVITLSAKFGTIIICNLQNNTIGTYMSTIIL